MLYTKLPKIKGFHVDFRMDESYKDLSCADEWDAVYLCDGNHLGVTYNYCYDGVGEMSAIYKVDDGEIDTSNYIMYEIDFGFDDWKDRLIDAMIDAYHEFYDT